MSERLEKAPVYFALAQVGFSPVMSMGQFVPAIQESMRRNGYPEFQQGHVMQVRISEDGIEAPVVETKPLWFFMHADQTKNYVLTSESLTFQTTHYDTHESFIPETLSGFRRVHEAAGLSAVKRLGMRYLDAIQPAVGETVNDYLVEGLHGVAVADQLESGTTELTFRRHLQRGGTSSRIVIRVHRAEGPIGFPMGLEPSGLLLQPRFSDWGTGAHAVIDTDHFVEHSFAVETESLRPVFEDLHESVAEVFRACATPLALRNWSGMGASA